MKPRRVPIGECLLEVALNVAIAYTAVRIMIAVWDLIHAGLH